MLSDEQLLWMRDTKRSYIKELFDTLGAVLGTRLTSEEFWGSGDTGKQSPLKDTVSFPLSFLLAPEVSQNVFKAHLAKPNTHIGNGVKELGDVISPAALRDMFRNIGSEAKSVIDEIKQPKS